MEHIIHDDISRMLLSISIQYYIPIQILQERYLPNIHIEHTKYTFKANSNSKSKSNSKNTSKYTIIPHAQCHARIWNNGHVHFDDTSREWICGAQCKRHKFGSSNLCSIHNNIIQTHGHLSHGLFTEQPPHQHFHKFILKLTRTQQKN